MNLKIHKILRNIFMGLVLIWTLFPVYWILSIAFRNSEELKDTLSMFNKTFSLTNFTNLFTNEGFGSSLSNSFIITSSSLLLSLVFGIASAYVLERKRFKLKARYPILIWILLVRILPPITFALPLYIMMNTLGIINTKLPIILAHVLINLPFVVWLLMSFISKIPLELEESAKIDGASESLLFIKVILPLILPGIAAVTIFVFMTSWNEYLYSVIFVQSPDQFTVPLKLATFNSEQELAQWGKVAAGGVMSLLPVMIFAIFMQKYLIKGLSSGAIKE